MVCPQHVYDLKRLYKEILSHQDKGRPMSNKGYDDSGDDDGVVIIVVTIVLMIMVVMIMVMMIMVLMIMVLMMTIIGNFRFATATKF